MDKAERKWPKVVLTEDCMEKLKAIPMRAFWAEEDEPLVPVPSYDGQPAIECRCFPVHLALEYGLVRECGSVAS